MEEDKRSEELKKEILREREGWEKRDILGVKSNQGLRRSHVACPILVQTNGANRV